eukprot:gene11985-25104_t
MLLCRRLLSANASRLNVRYFSRSKAVCVKISFMEGRKGDKITVDAPLGKSVLDVALDHNIDIEGACGGELACSTCHVVVPKEYFDKIPKITDEEQDMLDLAWGLTDTSRLCCQIKVTGDLEGVTFHIPDETNNML